MKIAFDEHVPMAVARAVTTLAAAPGFKRIFRDLEIISARQYAPRSEDPDAIKGSDAPWIARYAADGGKVIVSADKSMNNKPAEILALINHGMVIFWLPSSWCDWKYPRSVAFIFAWIERIVRVGRSSRAPFLYRIPTSWSEHEDFLIVAKPTPLKLKIRGKEISLASLKKGPKRQRKDSAETTEPPLLALIDQIRSKSVEVKSHESLDKVKQRRKKTR